MRNSLTKTLIEFVSVVGRKIKEIHLEAFKPDVLYPGIMRLNGHRFSKSHAG